MLKWKSCVFLVVGFFTLTESYSKYGRTCKDIGCLSNEQCVMETTPCSYYQKDNECGSYPTCKRLTNSAAPSCSTFVCPPTQVCTMEGSRPRCVEDRSKVGRVGYDTGSVQNPTSSQNNQGGSNLYPSIPRSGGETTPRPSAPQPSYPNGPGYQGGQIGSGYPGQTRPGGNTYPQQPSYPGGYNPQQGGGYPQQGYNNRGGYPQQGYNGYPQQGYNGYPQQGYNNYQGQGYQGQPQGGYNPYGGYQNNRYGPQNSGASPSGGILDKITETLKSYGTDLLKQAIAKKLAGN